MFKQTVGCFKEYILQLIYGWIYCFSFVRQNKQKLFEIIKQKRNPKTLSKQKR